MKKLMYFLISALTVLAVVSCKKSPGNPSVKTLPPTEIDAYSARLQARIDFAGVRWASVNYGFYWGTNEDAEGTYIMGEGTLDETNAYSAEITGLSPDTEYWFKAFAEIDGQPFSGKIQTFTTQVEYGVDGKTPLPKAVDIGLTVSGRKILWASFNLGASKEWEYGNYYAWGELDPKNDYSQATYSYKDNPAVLPLEKDAANYHLGGKWRMPTFAELQALLALEGNKGYAFERYDKYGDGDGVKDAYGNVIYGLRITQLSTGNSIYLPIAGGCDGTNIGDGASEDGYYWSSTINDVQTSCACGIVLGGTYGSWAFNDRYLGSTIRPVWEE